MLPLRQKCKDEGIDLMQGLVKLIMHSLSGVHVRKDNIEFIKCKFQTWMEAEYDDNVLEYCRLLNGKYVVEIKKDDGLVGDIGMKKTQPSYLGAFTLSTSKRMMNNFFTEINCFYKNSM